MLACVPNIGRAQRRRRLITGAVAFGAAVLLAVAMVAAEASTLARAALFIPLYAAGIGFFQFREKT